MKRFLNEYGRSVFGILRVMAFIIIIGALLFVIGKWFLRVLFEDSASEATFKELSSRAISASAQLMAGNDKLSSNEFGPTTNQGYPATTYATDSGFFEITLDQVPESVCRRMLDKRWRLASSLYVNGRLVEDTHSICRKFNQMSFEFSRDLRENIPNSDKPQNRHCITDSDCAPCEGCRIGRCQTGCKTGEACGYSQTGQNVCCAAANKAENICCSYIEDGQCCKARNQCCPLDRPIRLSDGRCVSCYDTAVFDVGSLDQCLKMCPNRVAFGQGNLCMLPICSAGQFMGQDGSCHDCTIAGGVLTSESECQKCPARAYQEEICRLPCPPDTVEDAKGVCRPCSVPQAFTPAKGASCTASCPNRTEINGICSLQSCPDGSIADTEGSCFACAGDDPIMNTTPQACTACKNRVYYQGSCISKCPEGYFVGRDSRCYSCAEDTAVPVQPNSGECAKCPDRLGLNNYCFAACGPDQFRDFQGTCYDCFSFLSRPVLQTATCSVCPNRSVLLRYIDGASVYYCAPQQCPLDYFSDRTGTCYDCFGSEAADNVSPEECQKCPNRFWSPIAQSCLIKHACPTGFILDSYGRCQACASPEPVIQLQGHTDACQACPNRYVYGPWCRLCPPNLAELKDKTGCQKCGGIWDNRTTTCHPHPIPAKKL